MKNVGKIIDGSNENQTRKHDNVTQTFFQEFGKHLVMSNKTTKSVKQSNRSTETAIHFYPSAQIVDVNNIIGTYPTGTRSRSVTIHVGHNSMDQRTDDTQHDCFCFG